MADSLRGTVFGTDRRVLALAFARMADALGNSFLLVVLPLFIASGSSPRGGDPQARGDPHSVGSRASVDPVPAPLRGLDREPVAGRTDVVLNAERRPARLALVVAVRPRTERRLDAPYRLHGSRIRRHYCS